VVGSRIYGGGCLVGTFGVFGVAYAIIRVHGGTRRIGDLGLRVREESSCVRHRFRRASARQIKDLGLRGARGGMHDVCLRPAEGSDQGGVSSNERPRAARAPRP
jgi:hypothetical protein